MKITLELLNQYKISDEGLEFFKQNYPDGIEFKRLLEDDKLDKYTLHFIYRYLPLTDEDRALYKQYCDIDSSSMFCWDSKKITDSRNVICSESVKNSKYINESFNVEKSQEIVSSREISFSWNVYSSVKVSSSTEVVRSYDINSSHQIIKSNQIDSSELIANSSIVEDSKFIYYSRQVYSCLFGAHLNNCNHCLFCYNLNNKNYMIFNKSVTIDQYEIWENNIQNSLFEEHSARLIEIKNDIHRLDSRLQFSLNPTVMFNGLSKKFFKMIKQVPNYNREDAYLLFGRDIEKN